MRRSVLLLALLAACSGPRSDTPDAGAVPPGDVPRAPVDGASTPPAAHPVPSASSGPAAAAARATGAAAPDDATRSASAPGRTSAGTAEDTGRWVAEFDRVGPVRIGMTRAEAEAAVGGPLRAWEDDPRCDYLSGPALPDSVTLMIARDTVIRIDVDGSAVATAAGVRVGDSGAEATEAYAGAVRVEPDPYRPVDGRWLVVEPTAPELRGTALVLAVREGRVWNYRVGRSGPVTWPERCA